MKNYKYYICGLLFVVILFSGCAKKPEATAAAGTAGQIKVEPLTLPVVANKLTLTFWCNLGFKQQQVMSSWSSIEGIQIIEQKTNVKLDFMHPPVGGEREQLNVMIAARNLPDVIYTGWDDIPGGPGKMISDGVIIDINSLAKQYAPNLLAFWEKNPKQRIYTYTDENECFGMPYYWPDDKGYVYHFGYVVRGDWAEKLKLKHPTNVDEWYSFLKAIKTGDPNGNGKADELPLVAQMYGGLLETQRMFGIEPNTLFYVENNALVSAIHQPEYKEWLATMQKWYAEGLIDPDVLSTNRANLDNKVLTDRAGAYWSGAGTGQLGLYMKQKQNEGNTTFSLNPVPIPTTKKGERLAWLKIVSGVAAGITSTNKFPKETVKYFDYYFSDEGHYLSQIGPEGKAYNRINGEIVFTDYVTKNPNGLSFDSALILCGLAPMDMVGYEVADYWKYNISFTPQAASSDKIWSDYTAYKVPVALRFTSAEASTVASLLNDIRAMNEETVSKIILGQLKVDDYDTLVKNAENAGHAELFNLYKAAYQRSLKR